MSESNSKVVQTNNIKLHYYEQFEKHINSLGQRFREKIVIKQNVYNDIGKCLLLPKGKTSGFSPKFVYLVKQNFVLIKIAGVDLYYSVIGEAHETVSHRDRPKTFHELNSHYSWIPRFALNPDAARSELEF